MPGRIEHEQRQGNPKHPGGRGHAGSVEATRVRDNTFGADGHLRVQLKRLGKHNECARDGRYYKAVGVAAAVPAESAELRSKTSNYTRPVQNACLGGSRSVIETARPQGERRTQVSHREG